MGRKTGGHEIGAIYFAWRNLPNEFNANLENIHLIGLYYSVDAKINGTDNILRSIVDDLNVLETRGIKIGNIIVRGTIGASLFENLGGNMFYNFPKSFNNKNFCRICTITHDSAKTMTVEQEELLRSELLNARCDDENFCRK